MVNKIVLDRISDNNTRCLCSVAECCNCGRSMLVNFGKFICPECDCNGTLSLLDESLEAIDYEHAAEVLDNKGYLLCDIES